MSIENMTDEELAAYKPTLTAEPDFVQFWNDMKEASTRRPLRAKVEKADYPYKSCSVHRFEFEGADGSPVRGWYLLPKDASAGQPVPALIRYHGYTGTDYFFPHRMMCWCAMGMAVLSIDIRGQVGETPDPGLYPDGYMI